MTQSERPAGASEARAQEELRTIAEELKGVGERLRTVHQSLAPPAEAAPSEAAPSEAEAAQDVDDAMDLATQLRTVIECVLADDLEPATRELKKAAALGAEAARSRR